MRSCILLRARAARRTSSGPRSGRDLKVRLKLKFSAASAKDDSGVVNARAAHRLSSTTLMAAKNSVIIHGPAQNGGRGPSGFSRKGPPGPAGKGKTTPGLL